MLNVAENLDPINKKKYNLLYQAWNKPDFKFELMNNPRKILFQEFGVKIPPNFDVKTFSDTPEKRYLPLISPALLLPFDKGTAKETLLLQAQTDPTLRASLLTLAPEKVAQTLGLPLGTQVIVIDPEQEAQNKKLHLYLPLLPEEQQNNGELSFDELNHATGGVGSLFNDQTNGYANTLSGIASIDPIETSSPESVPPVEISISEVDPLNEIAPVIIDTSTPTVSQLSTSPQSPFPISEVVSIRVITEMDPEPTDDKSVGDTLLDVVEDVVDVAEDVVEDVGNALASVFSGW